jgi:hypothetical protein
VIGCIALSGLALAIISRLVFAQQPAPTVSPITASERSAPSDVSERERILLERIEQLERRLSELEARLDATAMTVGKAAAPTAGVAPQQPPAQRTWARALPKNAAWDKNGVKIIPYGVLVANVNYNSSALVPGSIAGFALFDLPRKTDQFNISPGNTYLGVDIKWPKIGDWEINGKVDFNLRGPTPLKVDNVFAPLFVNIYGEARTERYRLLAGQTVDVIFPVFANTLNGYPFSFLPGDLGFVRPQVRFETFQPINDDLTFIFQGAITQAVQTFRVNDEILREQTGQITDEVFGDQGGLPDGQIRLALGRGKPDPQDRFRRRPFELGVSSHLGKRRGRLLAIPFTRRDFTTWSGNIDLTLKIGGKLRIDAEYFKGSVLGDYGGGVFQTFNPDRFVAIRASGGWAQLSYNISNKWQVNAGYGRDDPFNRDLSFRQRSLNEMGFGNFFYRITPRLWVATEFSRWKTDWGGLPTGRAFRIEPAVLFFF